MSNDDTFNESDEMFSLYSSKKITDTFKAQLKKIAANNHHSTDCLPRENSENNENNYNQKTISDHTISETPEVIENIKENYVIKDPGEILEIDISNSPIALHDDESLDDSIQVVSESTPKRITRQSERLRRKKKQASSEPEHSWSSNSGIAVNNKKNRNRKGRKKKISQKGKQIDEITLEDSPQSAETEDELNPVMSVKVIWKSVNVKKFQIRKFQKLSYIFEILSKEENIPENKIILTFNNVRVNRNDTPDSLNLQVYHFLDGGILTELTNFCQSPSSKKNECDNDSVMLKFQDVNKRIVKLKLNKHEKLKVAMIKCSEQLEVAVEKIKFFFDGELLNPSDTLVSLGLENDEVIDIKIYD